jgi:ribose transport system substrate-binding protein
MKLRKQWALVLCLLMLGAAVFATGDQESGSDSAAAADADLHEIYKILPKVPLSGVFDPNMADRSNIEKAFPVKAKDPNNVVIGWSEITLANPWFVAVADEAKRLSKDYGFELKFLVADFDIQKQSQHIDTFITQDVDIIVVDPVDIMAPAADIKRAVEAGIPTICIGTVPDYSAPILTTVIPNPFENGFESGKYIGEQWDVNEVINAGYIIGVMGSSTSESRGCGTIAGIVYSRAMKMGKEMSREDAMLLGYNLFEDIKTKGKFSYPELDFNVLAWGVGSWTDEGGMTAAEDMITAHKDDMNLILGGNDFMAMGALKAVTNYDLKKQIKVAACGADGFREALDLVKSGDIMCTGPFAGSAVGAAAVELIHLIFDEGYDAGNMPMGSYFPAFVISPDTIDEYYDPDTSNPFYKLQPVPFRSIPEILADGM